MQIIESGFKFLINQSIENTVEIDNSEFSENDVQFHFCVRGKVNFVFSSGKYIMPISKGEKLILFNPNDKLKYFLESSGVTELISIFIKIDKFHNLFSENSIDITFLKGDSKNNKHYDKDFISPSVSLILNQMIKHDTPSLTKKLYLKAKCYEIFSVMFSSDSSEINKCPVISSNDNLMKIKKAKEIIVRDVSHSPTLAEISDEIELSLKKLKRGFKSVYGKTVHEFMINYKIDVAKTLLIEGNYNINEISLKLGFSNCSYFIKVFKDKVGLTPKVFINNS